ncbi:MAG: ABC transporter ATP-binding protein, partial [Acidimicrobiaceae bacterium]|nr:ABC transporter ATP-binding protein [Acidimicrobiaceae bacterium]
LPSELSGGQQQRGGIARAIVTDPAVLICDEPVSALDVSIQAQIINVLDELRDTLSLAMLFIAHDLSVVRHLSDRVAVMYLGQIVETGTASEVFSEPRHPYTQGLITSVPRADAESAARLQTARRLVLGELPSLLDPPSGCRYRTRCPYATDECAVTEPAPEAVDGPEGLHSVRCHHHTSIAARSEPEPSATSQEHPK